MVDQLLKLTNCSIREEIYPGSLIGLEKENIFESDSNFKKIL